MGNCGPADVTEDVVSPTVREDRQMKLFRPFQLSETAKAVLWLWQNDASNWVVGTHAVVHGPTGIGVWTAHGLHAVLDIPEHNRANAHTSGGREVRLCWRDRRALYRIITRGIVVGDHERIQRQISDWGADKIANRSHVRQPT